MRKFFLSFFAILLITSLFIGIKSAQGDELDEINKQIEELTDALNQSKAATTPLEDQVESIKGRIVYIENDVITKEKNINKGYADLEKQTDKLNAAIRNFYIKSYYNSPILIFLSGNDASTITQILAFQKATANQDKETITNIALTLNDLEKKKAALEDEKIRLASAKANLDKVIGEAKEYQNVLGKQIADLSARQQEIINARSGQFTASIGDSGLADDYKASIKGFRESAPSGYFAVFSFGAYTHRKGMSQYGARGRAESGQNASQILQAYYGKEPTSQGTDGNIKVEGYGEMDFEGKYLMGIAEMPSSWHAEALKAQAIAARTYAKRYKDENKEICTTQSCQVYRDDKANNPPDAWRQAVQDTKGQVLEDVVTYYASTHGGFASPIGWDTTDGGGGSNFVDKAYDKLGGSPWLYKAWYTEGYSPSSDKCGRDNPWLNPEEMADIVNAALGLKTGGLDTSRITPVTTSCWGGDPYSMSELREKVPGSISSASSVSVTQGNGNTSSVTINGVTLSGDEFKKAFNLRAPGRLSIPQSGFAFFNVEKK